MHIVFVMLPLKKCDRLNMQLLMESDAFIGTWTSNWCRERKLIRLRCVDAHFLHIETKSLTFLVSLSGERHSLCHSVEGDNFVATFAVTLG